jgi:hypothetical protein
MACRGRNRQRLEKEDKELKIIAIDGSPKQVIAEDVTECNAPKLKNLKPIRKLPCKFNTSDIAITKGLRATTKQTEYQRLNKTSALYSHVV